MAGLTGDVDSSAPVGVCEIMKAMVLGIGAVGSVTAGILANSNEYDKVVLADIDFEKAKKAEKKISNDKVTAKKVDASDVDGMVLAFEGIDLVMNGVIPRFNYKIMDACVQAKANYADMAWDVALDDTPAGEVIQKPPVWHSLKKDAAFKEAGLAGMIGLGCDPGLSNIFARMAADRMDKVKEILVRDGDNGYVEGYDFAPLWSPETLIEEVLMPATYYAEGAYRKLPPFSGKEKFSFPDPVGDLNIYNVDHEEQETLPTFIGEVLGKGCDYCDFKIALGDEYVDAIKMLGKLGLDSPEKINVKGVKVAPRDVVAAVLPDPSTIGDKAKGDCAIGSAVKGEKDGKDVGYFIWTQLNHEDTYKRYGHSATAYSVGVPLAIAGILFAQGKITQKGVFPPEMLDPEPFVEMLPKFGMNCFEKKL
ncbi:MAG: saccharopine dehydrogenase NADP-binding domain-containing protein [Thermoplasmata archaeon]|nr:saccharopine dehydrogenase NADP-binding domain-containing protein [Thermoplasmata archaeon]TFG67481.1 MAG: saccharopine dehydrogenase-like oxidoreductase [Methanomassiliicoccus sp.]